MDIRAYAKINLTLDVTGKRPDGYHLLRSIMCAVDIFDEVHIEPAVGISVRFDADIPAENTALRAAREFCRRTGQGCGIAINKHIPQQAGMGGGSADAAAVLRGLNRLYGNPLLEEELFSIGVGIGADVPFCLMGGCALAEGIGELLTPLPAPSLPLVIVKGSGGVSTRALFSGLRLPLTARPDTASALTAIKSGDIEQLAPLCVNALEPPAAALLPEILQNRRRLESLGARAFMTGSGSAVVGIFKTAEEAKAALPSLRGLPFARFCSTGSFVI